MQNNGAIDELESAWDAFSAPLRTRGGFHHAAFQQLCDALRACEAEWSSDATVPKRLASTLVDMAPAIEACSHLYSGEEAEAIRHAADTAADLVRACVQVEWEV